MIGQEDPQGTGNIECSRKMIFIPILEEGVYRFDCDGDSRKEAFPSISFLDPKARDSLLDVSMHKVPDYVPFCQCHNGQQVVTIELPDGSSLYGTGEVSGSLERTGKRVFTWNTDAWGYGVGTTSLYQSHPWVLAILPNGEAYGVLADTTRRCEVDMRKDSVIKFSAPSVYPVITFGPFTSPAAVLTSLSHAIGNVFMPPKWSLGYHQCRWSYATDTRVREVAKCFREKRLPCDVIWMDIDYMHGFRCFTFDPERFSDPQSLENHLHTEGFKAIWMIDPGIKKEEGYFVYDSGCLNDVWVLQADGKPYVGEVWPGQCVFPDFTQAKTRLWWSKLISDFVSNGVDGIWNDMNEPAVFKTVTKTMPESNIHRGDEELGGCQKHPHYHNVYGMLMARSTYEGMLLASPERRPFVLTRAGYIGSQRYAATWTGDNLSTWEHLHMSITMALNLGLSGQPFSGPDIGGFAGNATPRLFARWMGIGTMLPFSRGHSESGTMDKEPWVFGPECEQVCQLALQRRYRFLPHLYTLFYLAHTKGELVAAPLFFADSKDPNLRNVEDAFLLGPLLVSASTASEKGSDSKEHVLPKGIWRRFDFDDSHPDLPSLYLQGGSIVPVGPSIQHVGEADPSDTLTLVVALDEQGKAEGILFEDENDGYGYQQGQFLLTYYEAELSSSTVSVKVSRTEGLWKRPKRELHIQLLLGEGAKIEAWGHDGEKVKFEIPPVAEVVKLVAESQQQHRITIAQAKRPPDEQELHAAKGAELSRTPVDLKSGEWHLKVIPWIGGRMISMAHIPSGTQWLHSRVEIDGYEEYSGAEYRSSGCSEPYIVIKRDLQQAEEQESLALEGDIGGGLVLQREFCIPKSRPKVLRIESNIIARSVGAGSGGFSRLVCLRVHPTFTLVHPTEVCVKFTSVDGTDYEVYPEMGEKILESNARPNGKWMLVDKCQGVALVNRFDLNEVSKCLIYWGPGTCNLELWSEERPVSKDTPLPIYHEYEVIEFQSA
uniref:Glycoside hydrolase family 31 N-terminal domain-containing protein n=1 Tax=Araucaria cunninghamii TaxID=56994 RepID=A0A0D6QW16_ARACU